MRDLRRHPAVSIPPMTEASPELFDKIVNLSKRRGIVFPSAEIYGGFRSTYDYGPVLSLIHI